MSSEITFTRGGTGHAVYTEIIDLAEIGQLAIARATAIEFDNNRQCWQVRDERGDLLYHDKSRGNCLEWEKRYLEIREGIRHELQHGDNATAAGG